MAADENLTTSRLLNTLAHDIDTKAAAITTVSGDKLLVYDISVGKVGYVTIGDLTLTDLTAVATALTVGEDGTGYDVTFYSATAGKSWLWDESADKMIVTGASDFLGEIIVGVSGTGHDVTMHGDTAGQKFFWDQSLDTAFLTCTVDIDGTVTVGVDDTGYDVTFFGATAGKKMVWDESADSLIVTGTVSAVDGFILGGTTITATGAEINAAADVSAKLITVPDGAAYSVLAANSGKTHVISGQTANVTLTLPSASAGLEYVFVGADFAAEAQNWIFASPSATNYFIGGLAFADTDAGDAADEIHAGVYPDGNSNDNMTIVTPAAGTRIHLMCNGTLWIVNGQVFSATVPTFAD